MKRMGNIYNGICSMENLRQAEAIARIGKENQYGVRLFDRNAENNLLELRDMLLYKEFTTSPYKIFRVRDPKERDVHCLPYYPDRIVHHAAMLQLEHHFVNSFTADTYSSIKGKGIHAFGRYLKNALQDYTGTQYCLKIDVRKFYQSIDHDILKYQLRRKFKDPDLLWLLDDIVDSAPGVPIGNYLSQYFANFYLSQFDHWIKEVLKVKYYLRYCDDIVILAPGKEYLHQLLASIRQYLDEQLGLTIKSNYQIFPVDDRGIDVVGYVYFHEYTLMRKSIKQNFARALSSGRGQQVIASYMGWAKHCNSNHLIKKLFTVNKMAA